MNTVKRKALYKHVDMYHYDDMTPLDASRIITVEPYLLYKLRKFIKWLME